MVEAEEDLYILDRKQPDHFLIRRLSLLHLFDQDYRCGLHLHRQSITCLLLTVLASDCEETLLRRRLQQEPGAKAHLDLSFPTERGC